jgi:hypothetical protein
MSLTSRLAGAVLLSLASVVTAPACAQQSASSDTSRSSQPARPASWTSRVTIRGYAQLRYNRLLENNPRLICTQCDRSMGQNGGLFLRRARFTVTAQPTERLLIVLQPDFTAEAGETAGIAQVRDAFAELSLDSRHETRLRFGQTNVPFGFENLVSSAKRLAFDRADALNSAVPTERDMGLFLLWTPRAARERYRQLAQGIDKGTGDYGVISLAAYNGQTANRAEQNNSLHTAMRVAYPIALAGGQIIEPALFGYTGRYVVTAAQRTAGGNGSNEFRDERAGAALVLHPRPVGLQAEWTIGTGPQADAATKTIRERHLQGGYVQAMVRTTVDGHALTPYARAQRYDGGKKFELDAREHHVRELEIGSEYMMSPEVELTAAFMTATRETSDFVSVHNRQSGHRLRLQAQFMF